MHRLSARWSAALYLCRSDLTQPHVRQYTHRRNHLEFATSGGALAVLGFNILTTVVVILGNVLLFIFLPIIAKSEKFHRRSSLEMVSAQRFVCVLR